MPDLKITTEEILPEFVDLLREVGESGTVFSHTRAALQSASELMQETWIRYASGTPIPGAPRIINSRTYAESIQLDDSDPDVKLVFTDSEFHNRVEQGRDEIDMKKTHPFGPKARMGKRGPYNVIPFRHTVPGAGSSGAGRPMPANIYRLILKNTREAEQAKEAGLSDRGGFSRVLRASENPEERVYEWGARLPDMAQGQETKRLDDDRSYTHKTGRYSGMVRMDVSTAKAKRSNYLTFRTISVNSPPNSWIIPREDPIDIRQAVVDRVIPIARDMLAEALERDLS